MNPTGHGNLIPGSMPDPSKEQQAEYYRLYAEIEAWFKRQPNSKYMPSSRLIHAEVVRRMELLCTP